MIKKKKVALVNIIHYHNKDKEKAFANIIHGIFLEIILNWQRVYVYIYIHTVYILLYVYILFYIRVCFLVFF